MKTSASQSKPPRRVTVVWPDGRVTWMSATDAQDQLKAGDGEFTGEFSIRMKRPTLRGLRGPSCAAKGSAQGRDADGDLKTSYVEDLVRRPTELREIGIINQRMLAICGKASILIQCPNIRPEYAQAAAI